MSGVNGLARKETVPSSSDKFAAEAACARKYKAEQPLREKLFEESFGPSRNGLGPLCAGVCIG
jgi:hypothetical protein